MSDLEPYRVEWRSNRTTRWMLMAAEVTRDEADARARAAVDKHGGYARLVSQHVIAESPGPARWVSAPPSPLPAARAGEAGGGDRR
jgi:hypothetical protein